MANRTTVADISVLGLSADDSDGERQQKPPSEAQAGGGAAALVLRADSIYGGSPVELSVTSGAPFTLECTGTILSITTGSRRASIGAVESAAKDGNHAVRVDVLDWISEKEEAVEGVPSEAQRYGMRFYPFISGKISGEFKLGCTVESVVIDMPDSIRALWDAASVVNADGVDGKKTHAQGAERSKYIVRWEGGSRGFKLQVPVRLGGAALLKFVEFPIIYLGIALGAVSVAASQDAWSVSFAAVIAVWLFMLRHWGASNLPQRSTLLTHCYAVAALIVLSQAVVTRGLWPLLDWYAGAATLFLSMWFLRYCLKVATDFSLTAALPRRVFCYWARVVARDVNNQKLALRSDVQPVSRGWLNDDDWWTAGRLVVAGVVTLVAALSVITAAATIWGP